MTFTTLGEAAAAVVDKARQSSIKSIRPASRDAWLVERNNTVGGSESTALLDINPYLTAYELFMRKIGAIEPKKSAPIVQENSIILPPMERGNFFEEKALDLARMLRPDWEIISNPIPGGVVNIDTETRMSSTPDATIIFPGRSKGTIQIKNVESSSFNRSWKQDGEITPPLYVAVQAMQDAVLAGAERAFVGAMVVGYNVDFHLIEVPIHAGVMDKLREAVSGFWDRVARNDPPPMDYTRDADTIARIFADDDGGEIEITGERVWELLAERDKLKDAEAAGTAAKKAREPIDAELMTFLGNAQRGRLSDGRVIEAKTVKRAAYQVKASTYRAIKVK